MTGQLLLQGICGYWSLSLKFPTKNSYFIVSYSSGLSYSHTSSSLASTATESKIVPCCLTTAPDPYALLYFSPWHVILLMYVYVKLSTCCSDSSHKHVNAISKSLECLEVWKFGSMVDCCILCMESYQVHNREEQISVEVIKDVAV